MIWNFYVCVELVSSNLPSQQTQSSCGVDIYVCTNVHWNVFISDFLWLGFALFSLKYWQSYWIWYEKVFALITPVITRITWHPAWQRQLMTASYCDQSCTIVHAHMYALLLDALFIKIANCSNNSTWRAHLTSEVNFFFELDYKLTGYVFKPSTTHNNTHDTSE